MEAPLAIDGLTKHYGRVAAVRGLTLEVREGEVFGFLGLNGAGKTTTIRVVLDLLRPTSGRASIFGFDCQRDGLRARACLGYQPGELGFFDDMTGRQVLDLLARLQGRPADFGWRRRLLDRFALGAADQARPIREYSTGMKRKLAIVQAFQHDPTLLVLDEPTEGLDPLMQEEFYRLLAEVTSRGRTVFLSSHVLSEVERVCDRVAVLREGELALLSTIAELRSLAPRRVRVVFTGRAPKPPTFPPGLVLTAAGESDWQIQADAPLGPVLAALSGAAIHDVEVHEPRLEDVLAKYYRRVP